MRTKWFVAPVEVQFEAVASVVAANVHNPVTVSPSTVPVQSAVPVCPLDVPTIWVDCKVNGGSTALVTVMVQSRLASAAVRLAVVLPTGPRSGSRPASAQLE